MGVMARATGHALADLALALTEASTSVEAVLETAARAVASMIGDCGGVRLIREDGGYGTSVVVHPDAGRARALTEILAASPEPPDDDAFSVTMRTTRQPLVLSARTRRPDQPVGPRFWTDFQQLGIESCLLCPLLTDHAYLGYLVLARTTPGSTYDLADVDLARDIAGEVALALATARSQERLRVAEDRYRRILETIPEGVVQLDPDGVATEVNGAMLGMLGVPRDQVLNAVIGKFLDLAGQKEMVRRLAGCRDGHAGVFETRVVAADGSTRNAQISMVPLPDDHGQAGGSLCMVTDITDQVQVRGLKRQLEHLRRLDSLGQLIGGIAHDFNNLFTVVAGSADMIAGGAEPGSPPHQLATEIVHASVKGRTLAHQLLAFGRGGGGRTETILMPDLLVDARQLFSRTLGEHIRLDITVGPDVWPVRAERGPLEQALVNLAANARDAMLHGGALTVAASNVTITAGQLDDPALAGRFVRLVIADTGVGMDSETTRRAFEPFFTTKSAAAGLGLATAAGILRGIGGSIRMESRPRIGTTVELFLPAADSPATTAPATDADRPGEGHILVVEDQPELAELIRRLLRPAGYTVTVAIDPHAAIAQVNAGLEPTLLLTDVVMPGMTGPELAAAVRERYPTLPVLYMSGYTAAALGPQTNLDPNTGLVQKPFNRDTLLTAVQRALS